MLLASEVTAQSFLSTSYNRLRSQQNSAYRYAEFFFRHTFFISCEDFQMKMNNLNQSCFLIASAFALFAMVGCGEPSTDAVVGEANSSNIQRLSNLYIGFQYRNSENGYSGPADEAEFKEFVSKFNTSKLERMGIDTSDIDAVFISERDNEPFKIRYNIPGSSRGSSHPAVFEAVGVEGSRMVGFLDMVQKEVDASEYDQLWSKELGEEVAEATRGR